MRVVQTHGQLSLFTRVLTSDTEVIKTGKDGHVDETDMWAESVRRWNAQREHELRRAWADFHRRQAERARRTMEVLIARHEAEARKRTETNASHHHHHEEE